MLTAVLVAAPVGARDLDAIRAGGELRVCIAGASAPFYEENGRSFARFLDVRPVVVRLSEWDQQFIGNGDGGEARLLADGSCDLFPNDLHITATRQSRMRLVPYYRTRKVVIANRDLHGVINGVADLAGRKAAVQKGTAYDAWMLRQNETTLASKPIAIEYRDTAESMKSVASHEADFTVSGLESAFYWVRSDIRNLDILFPVDDRVEVGWGIGKHAPDLHAALAGFFAKSLSVGSDLDREWQRKYSISLMEYKLFESGFAGESIDIERIVSWLMPVASGFVGVLAAMLFWTRRLNREIAEHRRTAAALRETQEILRQSEERFRLLFNSSNDLVWLSAVAADSDRLVGNFIEVNDAACRCLGYSRDDMRGMKPIDIDEPNSPDIDGKLEELARSGTAMFERVYVARDGRRIPVEVNARQIVHNGETLLLAICRDISQRKAMEEELKRSNAELEQFAYVASHDLRQPLRMVASYLTLIEKALGKTLDAETREFLAFAKGGAVRMDALIVALLEYSRTGRRERPFQPVPLGEVVATSLDDISVAADEAGATVTVAPDLPVVMGDRIELNRLFTNLLGNAVKYRQVDGAPTIDVGWSDDAAEWIIRVRDNGIGIARKDQERAFGIFQRLVSRDQYEGTGIGLAVCRKIMEHHGGRIWIESQVGQGSTFLLAFPKVAPPSCPQRTS